MTNDKRAEGMARAIEREAMLGSARMKPLLVGEANPYGADPRYALFPAPRQSAGYRLARLIMGAPSKFSYIESFDRANLCPQKWSVKVARGRAIEIMNGDHDKIVLLGRKVADAFGFAGKEPFTAHVAKFCIGPKLGAFDRTYVLLPHPSGLCRIWNEPDAFERANQVLRDAGVIPDSWRPKP